MHGKTIEMQNFSIQMKWRRPEKRDSGPSRDRSLPGKARIRARKRNNKLGTPTSAPA